MFKLINHVGENMIKYLHNDPQLTKGTTIRQLKIKDVAEKFTTDAVASCAFGLDGKSFEDPDAEFKKMGEIFSTPSLTMALKNLLTFIIPPLAYLFRMK